MFIMLLKACQYEYLADTNQKAASQAKWATMRQPQAVWRSGNLSYCLFVGLAARRLSVQIKDRLRNRWDIRVYLAAPVASGGQVFSLNTNYPMGSCAPPAYRCRSTTSSRESQVPVPVQVPQSMAKSPELVVRCADASSIFVKLSFGLTFTFDQHQVATGNWPVAVVPVRWMLADCRLPVTRCQLPVATAGQTVVSLLHVASCTLPVARSRLPSALPSSLT